MLLLNTMHCLSWCVIDLVDVDVGFVRRDEKDERPKTEVSSCSCLLDYVLSDVRPSRVS